MSLLTMITLFVVLSIATASIAISFINNPGFIKLTLFAVLGFIAYVLMNVIVAS
ncbi:hypothetical protein VPFG_00223 [Vibrio phage nt-1]|uniref:Uncharacterized protein n=1 Tax=Vibrio phage nt-1 TaxID=115992 RepID=R9TGJ3_9CAUD|nr:hypothetical protein VPFG_00223 [Vibrio phage nt-1]AGN30223.1 hypothetical protein VPFG_00223 [Vibrio phage nt-1]